jgi:hypothetical protein
VPGSPRRLVRTANCTDGGWPRVGNDGDADGDGGSGGSGDAGTGGSGDAGTGGYDGGGSGGYSCHCRCAGGLAAAAASVLECYQNNGVGCECPHPNEASE